MYPVKETLSVLFSYMVLLFVQRSPVGFISETWGKREVISLSSLSYIRNSAPLSPLEVSMDD